MKTPPRTLEDWLSYAETVHAVGIDMGLDRVGAVADRLGFAAPDRRPAPRAIIVAGTNGKGSTCLALEALLGAAGLRVGTTLSPHVHRFNERVRIDGTDARDAFLCAAFEAVEQARDGTSLTYFEYSALVALWCFRSAGVDAAVLEVGLGGRLDAFNLVSADVAVITSIGLDHQAYLGDDLETIGREKAGVMRPGQQVVLGRAVTASVTETARALDCRVRRWGHDFDVAERRDDWDFLGGVTVRGIRRGALPPHNCALAIEAAGCLVRPSGDSIHALARVTMPGRFETWRLDGERLLVLDVAHNPAGAEFLREQLALRLPGRRFVALIGTLADKDSAGIAGALADRVERWICVPTSGPRALSAEGLAARLGAADLVSAADPGDSAADAADGLRRALASAPPGATILALGSFSLVEQLRDLLQGGFAAARAEAAVVSTATGLQGDSGSLHRPDSGSATVSG